MDLPDPGTELRSPALQTDFFLPTELPGSPEIYRHINQCSVVKSLVVNLYIYDWLTFAQGTNTIHEEKNVSSANGSGVTEVEF